MATGVVIRMHDYKYKTPNRGVLVDLRTGTEYTFVRPNPTTTEFGKWNVKLNDVVSFTISGGAATEVTLLKKHHSGNVFSYVPSTLLTGLVAYWKLDETSGQAIDQTDNGHDSTENTATLNQSGKIGTSFYFNGTDDYVLIPSHSDFDFESGGNDIPFSLSLWVNLDAMSGWGGMICRCDTGADHAQWALEFAGDVNEIFLIINQTDVIRLRDHADYDLSGAGWKHIVATYDASKLDTGIEIYIDSVKQTLTRSTIGTYTGMNASSSEPVTLGVWLRTDPIWGEWLKGYMDEIGIWKNKVLSQSEVEELYNSGVGLTYPFD